MNNIDIFAANKSEKKDIYFYIGLFSTMTAVSIGGVSVFYLLMLAAIIYKASIKISNNRSIHINRTLLLFVISISVSCILSFANSNMSAYWKTENLKKTITFILIFGGLSAFLDRQEMLKALKKIIWGFKYSAIISMVWGLAQYVLWYGSRVSLNKIIFSDILHINLSNTSWFTIYDSGIIRLTGLGWEPAYFSLAMLFGFIIFDSILLKIAFLVTLLLSTSRTGVLMLLFLVIIEAIHIIHKSKINERKFKIAVIALVLAIIAFAFAFSGYGRLRNVLDTTFDSLVNWSTTTSGGTHFNYIRYLKTILTKSGLFNVLFGYGFASSGYPYQYFYNLEFGRYNSAWSVESDYITMLLGTGVIGFAIYYSIFIRSIVYTKEWKLRKLLLCAMFGGIFYIYYGTYVTLIMILSFRSFERHSAKYRLKFAEKDEIAKC